MARSMIKSRKSHAKRNNRKTRNLRRHKKGKKVSKKTKRRSKSAKKSHNRRRRTRSSRYHIRGGSDCSSASGSGSSSNPSGFSLVPSTLSDIGRSIQYGAQGAVAAAGGNDGPINPFPYKDQLNGGELPDDVMLRA